MIKLNIKPLSVNQAWKGRRFKTSKYKSFELDMMVLLPKLDLQLKGDLYIKISYGFSSKLCDIDNPCKLVLDCLVKKYGFDDRQVFKLHQEKEIVPKGKEYIKIKINEIN